MKRKTIVRKAGAPGPALPPPTDWRTTDAHEHAKRKLRAREERHRITNVDPVHPVFSNFEVRSPSGMTYRAEIRDVASRQFSCTCTDFRINGLGTCKHIEAILLQLARRHRTEFKAALKVHSSRVDVIADPAAGRLRVERNLAKVPPSLRTRFDGDGLQLEGSDPAELVEEIRASRSQSLRISQDVEPWLRAGPTRHDRIPQPPRIRSRRCEWQPSGTHHAESAFPLPARRHAAPCVQRARSSRRRDGSRKNHPSDRCVRTSPPPRQGAAS